MNISVPINTFNRGKPFYPFIMNYLVLLIGFKDLAGRGVIKKLNKLTSLNSGIHSYELIIDNLKKLFAPGVGKIELEQRLAEISSGLSKRLGSLMIESEFRGNQIRIEVDDIANDLMNNAFYLIQFTMLSAGSLLILAYEISKDKPWFDKGPLWEFLRHCRHAAAHGGLFTFKGKEPTRLAEWGCFRIERDLQGTPLFKDMKGSGLLSPGDPIRLLWDIEQAYPTMSA